MAVVEVSDAHNEADFWLSPRALEALWKMEDGHFWHAARNMWITAFLGAYGAAPPRRVLEVGCGSGAVLRRLLAEGYDVTGVDTEPRLIRKASERCRSATLAVGDIGRLPVSLQNPYDVVGFFDVLEHLDRPQNLVRAALDWAKPGALVIATVPAGRSLHSVVDDLVGHKQRYEMGELARVFEDVGVTDVVEHGIFRTTLPLVRWQRSRRNARPRTECGTPSAERADQILCDHLRLPPAPVNMLMKLVCALECQFCLKASRGKIGGTIVAVGRWNANEQSPQLHHSSSPGPARE